jgi:putative ABC transport system ATP-binding protein
MLVSLDNLSKTYQLNGHRVAAMAEVSLSIDAGEFVALRGKSGCGKSTLLLAAGGLLRPDAGRAQVDGTSLYELSAERRAAFRATNIGFVFQQFHLVPYLNVIDNILAAQLGTSRGAAEARGRAESLIEQFGLKERVKHRPAQLSTGERQRTALARALLNEPKLLLADEPTGNLDAENAEIVLNHLSEFARDGGVVLLVTHDDRAASFSSKVYQMSEGRMIA